MKKKSAIRILLLSVSISLAAFSCDQDEFPISFCNPEKYLPLEIGNCWVYRNYKIFNGGLVDYAGIDSMFITADTLMLGHRYFLLEGAFGTKPIRKYLTVKNGQVVSSDNYVFFECPATVNSRKLHPVFDFDFPATISVMRLDTMIRVPAGNFNPIWLFEAHSMLEDTIPIVTYKAYYARNTGIVKFSSKPEPSGDFESYFELVRYHIEN
jgi:hypothetical protein